MTPAKVYSGELIEILRTSFLRNKLLTGNFQGKHLCRNPVPVTLRGMTLVNWVSIKSIFKRILRLSFGTDIQEKTMRLFIFKNKGSLFL